MRTIVMLLEPPALPSDQLPRLCCTVANIAGRRSEKRCTGEGDEEFEETNKYFCEEVAATNDTFTPR